MKMLDAVKPTKGQTWRGIFHDTKEARALLQWMTQFCFYRPRKRVGELWIPKGTPASPSAFVHAEQWTQDRIIEGIISQAAELPVLRPRQPRRSARRRRRLAQ